MLLAAQTTDRAPFVTLAIAARFDAPLLAAAGGTAGALAACLPALALGKQIEAKAPLRAIRLGIALLFLIAGVAVSVSALALV
jgi:putative Ca2+/H+ antiporter (TMEM165/GDT1 family)